MAVVSSWRESFGSFLQRTKPLVGVALQQRAVGLLVVALTYDCPRYAGGRWGSRQVVMALMGWATGVLQWRLQRLAMVPAGAKAKKSS